MTRVRSREMRGARAFARAKSQHQNVMKIIYRIKGGIARKYRLEMLTLVKCWQNYAGV